MKTRLTNQRKVVLEVIKSACYHPTAEQIYKLTKKQLPKISVGTVYRNLDILVSQNLIKRIDIPGEPARFDADLSNKAYFVCKDKKAIYDINVDKANILQLIPDNSVVNKVDNFNIIIFGTSKNKPNERSLRKGQIKTINSSVWPTDHQYVR